MKDKEEEKSIKQLIISMKAEIIEEQKNNIQKAVDSINVTISSIKEKVDENSEKIDDMNARIEALEKIKNKGTFTKVNRKSYSQAVLTDPTEHKKKKVLEEARKVIGLSPITDEDLDEYLEKGMNKHEALEEAAADFLKFELKIDSDEMEDLAINKVTRPGKEDTDRIYIHFSSEDSAKYIFRKTSQVKNENIKISQFIPPQLFKRNNELSRLTFIQRKQNENLKTQIRLGESDLILLTRDKEEKEWNQEYDLDCYGELPEAEWFKSWPLKSMPLVTSPAKGRPQNKKETHDISRNSDEENAPKKAKKSDVSSISAYFEKRDKLKSNSSKKV